ncbi:hypothetical protein AB2L28_12655 [Kineococcus sp. TBRC 1896]|uniref:PH (Pleckstrin Homology) domain-containing protein n=1 Tax=Kineococcus mangrovi TaxID=1660183 RepID=A0ABV4I331_9ACTN
MYVLCFWIAFIWICPEVPIDQLHYPAAVLALTALVAYRLLVAPHLRLQEHSLVVTDLLRTWRIPYGQIEKVDASSGLSLLLQGGEEVTVAAMSSSLLTALDRERRLKALAVELEARIAAADAGFEQIPEASWSPLMKRSLTLLGFVALTYAVALVCKLIF